MPKKLKKPVRLSEKTIAAVRRRQGQKGRLIDDKEDHVLVTFKTANTVPQKMVHDRWVDNPASADIFGVDTTTSQKIDEPERRRRKKEKGRRPAKPAKPARPGKRGPGPRSTQPPVEEDGTWPGYIIMGGKAADRAKIDASIKRNFSKSELSKTRGLVIDIGSNLRGGLAGVYLDSGWPNRTVANQKMRNIEGARHFMRVDKKYTDGDVITHEMIHHLRAQRMRAAKTGNKDITKREKGMWRDHDFEEATTDAETLARHNLYEDTPDGVEDSGYVFKGRDGKPRIRRPSPAGYYHTIGKTRDKKVLKNSSIPPGLHDASSDLMVDHDRAIITLPGSLSTKRKAAGITKLPGSKGREFKKEEPLEKLRSSGKKGKDLQVKMNKNFGDTFMGNSVMGKKAKSIAGSIENLDQYFAAVDKDGQVISRTHYRSPKLKSANKFAIEDLKRSTPPGGRVVKFNDGVSQSLWKNTNTGSKKLEY